MTKRNGGVFLFASACEVIEGAGPGHGTRDMPIRGQDDLVKAAQYYVVVPYNQKACVRARTLGLVEYLNRLHVK